MKDVATVLKFASLAVFAACSFLGLYDQQIGAGVLMIFFAIESKE